MKTARYKKLQENLNELRGLNSTRYLYTAKCNKKGKLIYQVDGLDMGASDFAYPGTYIEKEMIPYINEALAGRTIYSQKIIDTTWGHIFTACYPIKVQSKLGEGSTFTVRIPCRISEKEDALPKRADEQIKQEDFTGKRILLAEDNDLNAEIAMELLSEEGLEIERAENGVLCVEMLEKALPDYYDMILMDIQMPIMNGYEATQKIRRLEDKEKANIPIIAMTANAFAEDRKKALEVGMNDHVAKPIDMNKLLSIIGRLGM